MKSDQLPFLSSPHYISIMNDQEKDQLDQWQAMWDKASNTDAFKPVEQPNVNPQTSGASFFGHQNTNHPSDEVRQPDAKYWNDLYQASTHGFSCGEDDVEMLQENDKSKAADMEKAISHSPNPIVQTSVGKDQEPSPVQLGQTYTIEDLEALAVLKVKLHELEDKLNSIDAKGGQTKQVEGQIASMKKRIDELSDELGRNFPTGA